MGRPILGFLFVCFTIDVPGLEMGFFTSVEVAQPPRGPDVPEVPLADELGQHFILSRGLDGHQIHAALATEVAGVQPTHTVVLVRRAQNIYRVVALMNILLSNSTYICLCLYMYILVSLSSVAFVRHSTMTAKLLIIFI